MSDCESDCAMDAESFSPSPPPSLPATPFTASTSGCHSEEDDDIYVPLPLFPSPASSLFPSSEDEEEEEYVPMSSLDTSSGEDYVPSLKTFTPSAGSSPWPSPSSSVAMEDDDDEESPIQLSSSTPTSRASSSSPINWTSMMEQGLMEEPSVEAEWNAYIEEGQRAIQRVRAYYEKYQASMIIDDADKLRSWLTAILQPLCEADPAALAKYVLALIKKDKPEQELRKNMSDELEVFLQHETGPFIDKLFELLRTKEYLTKSPPRTQPKEDASSEAPEGSSGEPMDVYLEEVMEKAGVKKDKDVTEVADTSSVAKPKERKEDERERGGRRRRSRSRSPATRRRGRSRSPPKRETRKYHPRKNWRSSRRSRSRSPFRPSPPNRRSRSPPPSRYRRHSRSRSRSPKARSPGGGPGNPREGKGEVKEIFPPRTVLNEHATEPAKDGEKPAIQSVVVKAGGSEKIEKGTRCRDFDERGLCMRGELCPFDHGTDPVVLDDVVMPNVPGAGQFAPGMGPDYGAPGMMRPGMGMAGEYYPDSPGMDSNWGMPYRPRMGFDPMMRGRPMMGPRGPIGPFGPAAAHRDLINVPVMGMQLDSHAAAVGMGMPPRGMHMGRGRGRGFDHSRLGFRPQRNHANCSLEVKKIPREQNNIMDLNAHFQKFGKIVNIQIQFESDPEAALVTFSQPSEAQTAYRSTEAVLNNRFIRVFWHSKEKENEESSEEPTRIPAKDRLGGIEDVEMSDSQEKVLVSGNNITKTVFNPSLLTKKAETAAEKIQAVEAIKKSQEMLAAQESLKKKQEEKKKEVARIMGDLRKRKQDMLDEQIAAQKKVIHKLENGRGTMSQKEIQDCLNLIKAIQGHIEKLKKELEEMTPMLSTNTPKSKEEFERAMLDAELELYNREQEGGDTMTLQKKISDLRATARQLGFPYSRGRGRYRGSSRGFASARGRGGRAALRSLRTVDRRPTRIRIVGFPVARLPEILPHFSQFGTITEYETDTQTPAMILNFDNRKSAEMAVNNGKMFGESELNITWVAAGGEVAEGNSQTSASENGSQEVAENGASVEDDELGDALANEILLNYEEEEEEDEANRSWRR